jgi:hypothetical protein
MRLVQQPPPDMDDGEAAREATYVHLTQTSTRYQLRGRLVLSRLYQNDDVVDYLYPGSYDKVAQQKRVFCESHSRSLLFASIIEKYCSFLEKISPNRCSLTESTTAVPYTCTLGKR